MAKAQAAAATETTTPTGPATSARASDTSAQGPNAATKADLDQASDTPASSPSPGTIGEEEIRVRAYLTLGTKGMSYWRAGSRLAARRRTALSAAGIGSGLSGKRSRFGQTSDQLFLNRKRCLPLSNAVRSGC